MAVPQYRDEVLITLTSLDAPTSFSFPDRRFFLTREKPVMDIGRTSKRNSSFEAAKNNAWFDSPVMSRDHAQLKLDVEKQKVYIKDIGSLHGTFKNEQRLTQQVPSSLGTGDIIRFGISIDRGSERYPPCTMEARFKFGTALPEDRPKVFRVPDDSDVEDSSSDDDESIRNSAEIVRNANVRPAVPSSTSPSPVIEVIPIDQYPISNVRGDDDYITNALPPVASASKPVQEVTYVDLSSPSPEDVPEYNGFSPISPEAGWMMGAEDDDDINLSESTDMDTDSSQEADSPSPSPRSSPSPNTNNVLHDYDTQDALEMEEDDFEEHDEFEDGDYESESQEQPVGRESEDSAEQFTPSELPDEIEEVVPSLIVNVREETQPTTMEVSTSENGINPLGGVSYVLDTQLPPIEQPDVALPWVQPYYTQPLRLPSISEAMPAYSSQIASPTSGAELLGAKTGKYEFFAARAENKLHALPCGMATGGQSIPVIHRASSEHTASPNTIPQRSSVVAPTTPKQSTKSVAEARSPQTDPPRRLAPSEWTASGVQFLNSPLEDTLETRERLQDDEAPVLDDTSAYQFELSKRAVSTSTTEVHMLDTPMTSMADAQAQNRSGKRTHMEISDILESSDEIRDQPTPADRPSKRKADDISELMPEDRACNIEDTIHVAPKRIARFRAHKPFRRLLKKTQHAPVATMAAPTVSEASVPRPAKRLRRVAEVVGFAALGGVAVMSALIATAPAL
ncbi:hypothetical protein EDB81DRAFT_759212 [Dactylonectria macrodidyma]|uniref:FHA domain-containing protein n=1 Tax=Dactylonectria macrodidyma TaxID=307937 RepID=A0A9P9J3T8_9HYPO|nr:hypothetical protein EDB81DRAFT_759212 [Dactylonectria macrodidyma]